MNGRNEFRKDVFNAALDYLESETLTEKEVCESLKQCIEFLWSGSPVNDPDVTRDFCVTKLNRSKQG